MTDLTPSAPQPTAGRPRFAISARAVIGFAAVLILLPLVPFLAAGRLDWPAAWALFGIHVGMGLLSRLIAWRVHPDVLAERAHYAEAADTPRWDRLLGPLAAILGPLVLWIVAGLDKRLAWSPDLPTGLQVAAGVLLFLGYGVGTWAMAANAFFSAVVRIQKERGQTVVSSGPYRWVRHPAYAGGVVAYLAMPLLLDSLWALVPAALSVVAIVARTALEDRTLEAGLPGYAEYARLTRYRLLPGIW